MDGFRSLAAGDLIAFEFEPAHQDGYSYRALQVWPPGVDTDTPLPEPTELATGAWITLTVESPDGTVTTVRAERSRAPQIYVGTRQGPWIRAPVPPED